MQLTDNELDIIAAALRRRTVALQGELDSEMFGPPEFRTAMVEQIGSTQKLLEKVAAERTRRERAGG